MLQRFFRAINYSVLLIPLAMLIVNISFPFSTRHPDYEIFQAEISNLTDSNGLNLTQLNNGNWKHACLFGSYTNPSYEMASYGRVGWFDFFYQPMKAWPIIRLAQIEEHEAMIAFTDNSDKVTFIHFRSGRTKTERSLEHISVCSTRDKPIINDIWLQD